MIKARRAGEAVGLPGYAWDSRLHNYVNLSTGRMVSRREVHDLLRDVVESAQQAMMTFGRLAGEGQMTPREFYEAMKTTVRQAYNAAAALSKGGWAQMTPADWGANGRLLRDEYQRLRNFAQDLADGKLSPAQAQARAALYGDSAYGRYWAMEDARRLALGGSERLITVGDDRVCPICLKIEARGWQPLGTTKVPVHPACRCDKEYGGEVE